MRRNKTIHVHDPLSWRCQQSLPLCSNRMAQVSPTTAATWHTSSPCRRPTAAPFQSGTQPPPPSQRTGAHVRPAAAFNLRKPRRWRARDTLAQTWQGSSGMVVRKLMPWHQPTPPLRGQFEVAPAIKPFLSQKTTMRDPQREYLLDARSEPVTGNHTRPVKTLRQLLCSCGAGCVNTNSAIFVFAGTALPVNCTSSCWHAARSAAACLPVTRSLARWPKPCPCDRGIRQAGSPLLHVVSRVTTSCVKGGPRCLQQDIDLFFSTARRSQQAHGHAGHTILRPRTLTCFVSCNFFVGVGVGVGAAFPGRRLLQDMKLDTANIQQRGQELQAYFSDVARLARPLNQSFALSTP